MAKKPIPEYVCHIQDVLTSALGQPVTVRAMFGGHGLYCDGVMIALEAWERLYLKVDDQSRPAFESAGGEPFVYESAGRKPVTMSYWTPPEGCADEADALAPWARLALEAARRAAAAKPPKKAKSPKK